MTEHLDDGIASADARLRQLENEIRAAEARLEKHKAEVEEAEKKAADQHRLLADQTRKRKLENLVAWKDRFTIVGVFVSTLSFMVAAGSLYVAAKAAVSALQAYKKDERAKSLDRTYKLLEAAGKQYSDEARASLVTYFAGRFDYSYADERDLKPMSEEYADRLLKVSRRVSGEDPKAQQCIKESKPDVAAEKTPRPATEKEDLRAYNVARNHLNVMEGFAFAYIHQTADNETLAKSICPALFKSNAYFEPLIRRFRCEVGVSQSWQVIPDAVAAMEKAYGRECKTLYPARRNMEPNPGR